MATISTAQFKRGIYISFRGQPYKIVDFSFTSPGKGSAFYRTKLKSLETRSVVEYTFKSGEKMEEVYVETKELQYLYQDGEAFVFMNPRTFDQTSVAKSVVDAESVLYLKEGINYRIQFYQDNPVSVMLPKSIIFTVTGTETGVKGDTVTGASKPATLDTGLVIQVPLFVKVGDSISVNTDTGTYQGRVN